MIKILSYFHLPVEEERIGEVLAISNSSPKNVQVDGVVDCFVPPWDIVKQYKATLDENAFTTAYRAFVMKNAANIRAWLDGVAPDDEMYLCCWERTGFCHRQLVAKLIKAWRPDLNVRLT